MISMFGFMIDIPVVLELDTGILRDCSMEIEVVGSFPDAPQGGLVTVIMKTMNNIKD